MLLRQTAALRQCRMSETQFLRFADSFIPRFADTFEASVLHLRGLLSEQMVADDMALGLLNEPRAIPALLDSLQIAKAQGDVSVFEQLIAGASKLEGLGSVLTVQSPLVQRAAREMSANLIQGVTQESKRAVRQVLFESIRDGVPPGTAQKTIREIVGLSQRDALALTRFADAQRANALTPSARVLAERRIERYSQKLLRARGLNIARTETIRAGNIGRQLGWQEAADRGLIDRSTFKQRWMVTHDDRLCPRCAPMDGKLVQLGGSFEETLRGVLPSERVAVAGETVQAPPLHPQCRCTLVADFT